MMLRPQRRRRWSRCAAAWSRSFQRRVIAVFNVVDVLQDDCEHFWKKIWNVCRHICCSILMCLNSFSNDKHRSDTLVRVTHDLPYQYHRPNPQSPEAEAKAAPKASMSAKKQLPEPPSEPADAAGEGKVLVRAQVPWEGGPSWKQVSTAEHAISGLAKSESCSCDMLAADCASDPNIYRLRHFQKHGPCTINAV